ncbi:MAG: aminotransferase class I/II-fold pyridoxal phosphate-dependent enzyme [Anaerolineae bacterium]|nr:aminotransferase class I/II-fold pyridoxal phosphate-dependent enzyme [Anaerolineae bacterium]
MQRDPIKYLAEKYRHLHEQGLTWEPRELQSANQPLSTFDGREVLVFCSNNYLNLSTHPQVVQAMIAATKKYGAGAGSDRSIAGDTSLHRELDERLAAFKGAPASLTFQTGFMTNQGVLAQLGGQGDLYISDELNHGSIIDGIRLTKAARAIYRHKDVDDLQRILEEAETQRPAYKHIWIVTDGVFSMDGDLAPLPAIAELAAEHGAGVYVDDAHGEGVLGEGGRGIVNHFGLTSDQIHAEMGTFSKAFGIVGGHISGSKELIKIAMNTTRTWLLSGALPPGVAAATIAAIDVMEKHPERVERLWENRDYFLDQMQALGFDTGNSETPIVPIMCGERATAKALADFVWGEGIYVLPIVYPMVARGKARIRVQLCTEHTREQLDMAIQAFKQGGEKLGLI